MDKDAAVQALLELDPKSDEYRGALATLLSRIDPSRPFGTTLYDAIARLSISLAFEGVAIREHGPAVEVYLRRRAADDTAYPLEWHAPGSVFMPGERPRDVADRLAAREFGVPITAFQKVGDLFWSEPRGSFLSKIYLIEVDSPREDDTHGWFPVDALPEPMVDSHALRIIPTALLAWRNQRRR